MKMSACATLLLLAPLACREQRPVKHSIQIGPLHVRHALQFRSIDDWKIDMWLLATSFRVGEPIDVGFRLTPMKVEQTQLPKIVAELKLTGMGISDTTSIVLTPLLQQCQEMPEGREMTYPSGETSDFPPKERCWQKVLDDSFKIGWRNSDKFLEPGTYLLDVEVRLNNSKTQFKGVRVVVIRRTPHGP